MMKNTFHFILFIMFLIIISCRSISQQEKRLDCCIDKITGLCYYEFTEKMPIYCDGKQSFVEEIISNIHPELLNNHEIITRIKVQFIVNSQGNLIGARIPDKSHLNSIEKEVINIINHLDCEWSPGELYGKPVAVMLSYTININFRQ